MRYLLLRLPNSGESRSGAAAQKAILDKAAEYAVKTYAQLPALTAKKTTLRFQDNVEATASSSGMTGGARELVVGAGFVNAYQFIHFINSTASVYTSDHGIEKLAQDKTRWGSNRMIAFQEPDPNVGSVFQEAQAAGTIAVASLGEHQRQAGGGIFVPGPEKEVSLQCERLLLSHRRPGRNYSSRLGFVARRGGNKYGRHKE